MKNTANILTEISKLTSMMATHYPELYRYLDETPMTLPTEAHPAVDKDELEDYLESLYRLLDNHLKTHKKVNGII